MILELVKRRENIFEFGRMSTTEGEVMKSVFFHRRTQNLNHLNMGLVYIY